MTPEERREQAAAENAVSDAEFRQLAREWIAANYPLSVRNPPKRLRFPEARPWYLKLSERGWLAPGWPIEHGGLGLPIVKQLILIEELEAFGAARLNDMGVVMIGPLLIRFGTEAQRTRFLPKILSGEHIWCQGYSEPNSGSDLASLRTEAVRDGEDWVITGQKIWTTRGADANWMFGLFRTHTGGKKQDGISFLLVPMDAPGVDVRPILDISGDNELAQVFFDGVRIPAANLVGEQDGGWAIANALLGLERIFLGLPKYSSYALSRLEQLMRLTGADQDPAAMDRYVQLRLDLDDHIALYESFVDELKETGVIGPGVSILKIHQTELYQRITEMLLSIAGEDAGRLLPMAEAGGIFPAGQFLTALPTTIYGGSSEIQRNILATRVLGLPR
jgi:alkylation response protein AidB-like acyl-CoA dehydrogenase